MKDLYEKKIFDVEMTRQKEILELKKTISAIKNELEIEKEGRFTKDQK